MGPSKEELVLLSKKDYKDLYDETDNKQEFYRI